MDYPKFLYNKEEGARLLKSAEEEKALVGEWHDSPAAFKYEKDDKKMSDEIIEEFIDYNDLKVAELKQVLVEKFDHNLDDLKGVKKPELIEMIEAQ